MKAYCPCPLLQATEAVEAEVKAAKAALKALDAESDKRLVEGTMEVHAARLAARSVPAHNHKVTYLISLATTEHHSR